MIKINNLTKSYGKNIIFKDVSISLEDNTIYFLLGKNGSGKTTFIKCLLDLDHYKGNINYIQATKKKVFVIYDDIPLFENLNGYDNIRLLTGKHFRFKQVDDKYGASSNILTRKAKYYSLGEKKRLLLVAALLTEPQYLILDEIANGLDIDSLNWLANQLIMLKKKSLILVTGHYLEFYEKILDKILVIDKNTLYFADQKGGHLYDLYEKLYGNN